jgi:uncharacterized protein YcaQ
MSGRTDTISVNDAQVAAFRLRRHHLDSRAARSRLPGVVGDVCGVQTQVAIMARIALWARLRQLTIDDVDKALVRQRTITKTWSMRGALHLHGSNELLLYLGGLMPTRLAREQRWIHRAGLNEERTTPMVLEALKDGPLTRSELANRLAKKLGAKTKDWADGGWGHQTKGSSLSWYLVRPAMVRGLVCFGSPDGQEITFTKVDQWLQRPQSMPAVAEAEDGLVRRYFRSFGPADMKDLRAWSGMSARQAVAILGRLKDELVEVEAGGRRRFILKEDLSELEHHAVGRPAVRLLPCFDPFLLGHWARGHLVDKSHYKLVYKHQGWLAPVVLVDGRVAGTWSYERGPRRLAVEVKMFTRFKKDERTEAEEEAHDLSRFLEAPDMSIRFT